MSVVLARIVTPGGSNCYTHSYHQYIQDDVHVNLGQLISDSLPAKTTYALIRNNV